MKFNDIEVEIESCNDNQIKMIKHERYPYCEEPICYDDCPNDVAYCKGASDVSKNDPKLNHCECLMGYTGKNCSQKKFADFRY